MPANIKEIFPKYKRTTTDSVSYDDIKKPQFNVLASDYGNYSEYSPKQSKKRNKDEEIIQQVIEEPEPQYIGSPFIPEPMQLKMSRDVEEITCKIVDLHILNCKECRDRLSAAQKEKIIYLKSNKEETSQELMELVSFLATGIFIILVLDKIVS